MRTHPTRSIIRAIIDLDKGMGCLKTGMLFIKIGRM